MYYLLFVPFGWNPVWGGRPRSHHPTNHSYRYHEIPQLQSLFGCNTNRWQLIGWIGFRLVMGTSWSQLLQNTLNVKLAGPGSAQP